MIEITATQERAIDSALANLEAVRLAVQKTNPGKRVHWFLSNDELNLLVQPRDQSALEQNDIAYGTRLKASSGGDW